MVTAWNPVYTAPADLDLGALLAKVPNALYLLAREDETSRRCGWWLASHPLEAWGDLRSRDGMASLVQPLIAPLRESVTEVDLLAAFVDAGDRGALRHVRLDGPHRRAGASTAPGRAGSRPASSPGAAEPPRPRPDLAAVAVALDACAGAPAPGWRLASPPPTALDGRFAGNAWLQELPHPVSKLTWDNAALLSPATAKRLGVRDGRAGDARRSAAARWRRRCWCSPGHADEAVTLAARLRPRRRSGRSGRGSASTPARCAAAAPGSTPG